MDTLIKAEAFVFLYKGMSKRTLPIHSGYRPTFAFVEESRVSGMIELKGRESMYPGEICRVNLVFTAETYLGDEFFPGKEVLFYEADEPLGKAILIKIILPTS